MDLNESQLTSVLHEAFKCYLAFLSHQQKARERSLPRQGKGVELPADVLARTHYRDRVVVIETCIQSSDRIARMILRWGLEPDNTSRQECDYVDLQGERFDDLLEEEVSFVNPFTGAWIHPVVGNSAGSSGGARVAAVKSLEIVEPILIPYSHLGVENEEERSVEVKQIRPIFFPSTRPSLGIHPNVSLTISAVPTSKTPLPDFKAEQISISKSTRPFPVSNDGNENKSLRESDHQRNHHSDQADSRPSRDIYQRHSSDEDIESNEDDSESSDGNTSITSEMASSFYRPRGSKDSTHSKKLTTEEKVQTEEKARLVKQEAYARKVQDQERAREEQIRRGREATQRAQARWELAALATSGELRRKEESRRDVDARRIVDEGNDENSGTAEQSREQKKENRRLRHEKERADIFQTQQQRKDVVGEIPRNESREQRRLRHEKDRHKERDSPTRDHSSRDTRTREPSRTKHQDHERRRSSTVKASTPPALNKSRQPEPNSALKRARFSDREPAKRRSSSVVLNSETARRSESTRKVASSKPITSSHREESSRSSQALKKIDCVSCMEPGDKRDMSILACKHAYCTECINEAFRSALSTHTLFKCCALSPSPSTLLSLSPALVTRHALLILELSTPSPKYCSSPTCSLFLPPSSIRGPVGVCTTCRTRTCIPCGQNEHSGICKSDREGRKLQELAKKKGWKQCPNCSQILERTYGCLHMTCRCGAHWCYACLRDWEVCLSSCSRDEPENGFLHPVEPIVPPPGANAPRVANNIAPDFQALLVERMQRDGERRNGRGAPIFPVIATAVMLAFLRARE